ncbi:zinc ribbon domain-containing protein [Thermodesulfovibrio sp. TK110]
MLKEIESVQENLKKEEENLLLILYDLDEAKKVLKEIKAEIDTRKKEVEIKKKELEKEIDITTQQIDELKKERKQLINKLPSEIYAEYMELMKKHKGLAVAQVKNSVCQGCFLHIPPQLYVEIKLNQSIYHCPQCGRFLYYKPDKKLEQAQVQTQ